MPRPVKELPEFPPHIDAPSLAFGTTEYLPKYATLPVEYQKQQAPGCMIASTIFAAGWAEDEEREPIKFKATKPLADAVA